MLMSINPATEEVVGETIELTESELESKLAKAESAFLEWREKNIYERATLMQSVASSMRDNKEELARIAVMEMGKPISQAIAEVEKCAWAAEHYALETANYLAPEVIDTEATSSYVRFDPKGVILAVMPWNFPYWQVMRFVAPALMAGNVGLLKHASSTQLSAIAFEKVFIDSGFPNGVFTNLALSSGRIASLIADPRVKAIALTGSENAGSKVAETAGKYIKKSVLELGGSDPFIVLADADLESACDTAVLARVQNNGQSCIAGKRFIVEDPIYEEFIAKLKTRYENLKLGDPMDPSVNVGPIATSVGREELEGQVKKSMEAGARLVIGGKKKDGKGFFFEPTILADITPEMSVGSEETFGPVAAVMRAKDREDAVRIANSSRYALGASLWTRNLDIAEGIAQKLTSGAVFVNTMVKSDPRMPFGGEGVSGFGRELGSYGIKEFVNIKSVWIH